MRTGFTRARAITLIGSTVFLPHCANRNVIRVGSKDFSENITVAEIYAAALECAGYAVERNMILGNAFAATTELKRADIDLYPEYTGTGLIDILGLPPPQSRNSIFAMLQSGYIRFHLTWLQLAPGSDSQALAVTKGTACRFNLSTLSECARAAPQLRFATVGEFLTRKDALPGLQEFYGGFKFKAKHKFDIGAQYDALLDDEADVAAAFTTDAQLAPKRFVVLRDDRHFWPPYHIAPVVRLDALSAHPGIEGILNGISGLLTDAALRRLNVEVALHERDPAEVAEQFLNEHADRLFSNGRELKCLKNTSRRL
jgi:osmoprotectant transport system substrate-binding protein